MRQYGAAMKRIKRDCQAYIPVMIIAMIVAAILLAGFGDGVSGNRNNVEGMIAATGTVTGTDNADYWHMARVSVPQAQLITTGKGKIIIAVLDTGINDSHPVLQGKTIAEVNFSDSADVTDRNGHGTHVAGVIAGGFTELGIANGIAYDCSLLNVKVANDDGTVTANAVAAGIRWAVDNNADIINISLTLYSHNEMLEEAIAYAWENGALVIAAAGNRCANRTAYPAMYPEVVAVSATDKSDNLASYSNHGDWTDISAPGTAIVSSVLETGYASMTGTSMAAALVSGEAALLYGLAIDDNDNGRLNDEVRAAILDGSEEIDCQLDTGLNMVNAVDAIRELLASHEYVLRTFLAYR